MARVGFFAKRLFRRRPRILCLMAHYFGAGPEFIGKSTSSPAAARARFVRKAVRNLRAIPGLELRVCSIPGYSLLPLDMAFSGLERPEYLVFEVLGAIDEELERYDYFMVVEDDILVPHQVLSNVMAFDREHGLQPCLHPNRLERSGERVDCVDLRAMPGWQEHGMRFRGVELRVARNPHSGFLLLSRDKLAYGLERIDRSYRGRFLGGFMSSAFAHYHRPFELYRPYRDLGFHYLIHLDHWMGPEAVAG